MTFEVIILALAASCFTAMASVAQRTAAAPAPGELSFNLHLVGYLLRRPVWFLGILCMILGFVFQVEALRVGSLSVVQPVIATELVIVFGVIALHDPHRVHVRDWIAALGMVVGLGAFLALARPHGGRAQASMSMWALAGISTFALAGVLAALAYLPGKQGLKPGAGRKAALLGIAAAVGFGFVAAVVKELSSHLGQGFSGVFLNWSPYVLLISGAAAMFLASNAFQAGSLAASQPGLTIVDPLVAATLGVVLFGESLHHNPLQLMGEVLAVATVIASVVMLSRSPLVQEADAPPEAVVEPPGPPRQQVGGWVPGDRVPRVVRLAQAPPDRDKESTQSRRVSAEAEAP
jgi:fructose-specific component phosphotransferase system IIB-like protein